jgi:hypothetical protein
MSTDTSPVFVHFARQRSSAGFAWLLAAVCGPDAPAVAAYRPVEPAVSWELVHPCQLVLCAVCGPVETESELTAMGRAEAHWLAAHAPAGAVKAVTDVD